MKLVIRPLWIPTKKRVGKLVCKRCASRVSLFLFGGGVPTLLDFNESLHLHLNYVFCFFQGTYGGHLELSAFANLHQRPIKVIQPGMIYIIGYEDESPSAVSSRSAKGKAKRVEDDPTPTPAPLYIVYHQWEVSLLLMNLIGCSANLLRLPKALQQCEELGGPPFWPASNPSRKPSHRSSLDV